MLKEKDVRKHALSSRIAANERRTRAHAVWLTEVSLTKCVQSPGYPPTRLVAPKATEATSIRSSTRWASGLQDCSRGLRINVTCDLYDDQFDARQSHLRPHDFTSFLTRSGDAISRSLIATCFCAEISDPPLCHYCTLSII